MSHNAVSPSGLIMPPFSDPARLGSMFTPGEWLERRQLSAPSCIVISGRYQRCQPVVGGFQTDDVHFFDFSPGARPPDTRGRLVDCMPAPRPMGELTFVPAGFRYLGGGGEGSQAGLFLFLNARTLREEDGAVADTLAAPGMGNFMDLRHDRIRFLLSQIYRELHHPGFATEVMVEGLAITLLAETARLLKQTERGFGARGGLAPATLRTIRDRVLEGGKPPSVAELASLCGLSRRHLMRGFRESTGQTIGQFIQHTMVTRAGRLLADTDTPVGAVAAELGFESTSAFSSAFRRLTGETPRAYRLRGPAALVPHLPGD